MSPNARFVVTSGHDKSLRLWERTEEVLVLEDERETEREKEGEAQLATGDSTRHGCQMAIASFLERMCLALRGFLDYGSAMLRCKI